LVCDPLLQARWLAAVGLALAISLGALAVGVVFHEPLARAVAADWDLRR
jgi:hypothetical protein